MPVPVCPFPRLCRPIREPGAEHGPTSQGCAGRDPRAAAVLYAHQRHPASSPTPCQPQPKLSSRAALRSQLIQCLAVCLPAHLLLLLKARGTWSPGTHWEANLEDKCWLVKSSAPSPTEGSGAITHFPAFMPIIKLIFTSVARVLGKEAGGPRAWHHTKRRREQGWVHPHPNTQPSNHFFRHLNTFRNGK